MSRLPSRRHRNLPTVIALVDLAGWAVIVCGAVTGIGVGAGLGGEDGRVVRVLAGLVLGGLAATIPAAFAFALGYVLRLLADVADASHVAAVELAQRR